MESKFIVDIDALFETIKLIPDKPLKLTKNTKVTNLKGEISTSEEVEESDEPIGVNGPKYDTINRLLDILLISEDEIDTTLGLERAINNSSLGTQVAYNTLKYYKIIKEFKED